MTTATLTTKHPNSLGLWLARGLWLLTLLVVLAISMETLRHDYRIDIRYAWSVQEAQDAVVRVMPFPTYVNLIFAVRVAAGAVFTLAGILVFWRRVDDLFGIFVAGSLVLWTLPFALGLNLDELAVPALLAPFAPWLPGLITGATIVTFVLFYFLFPDGRFVPRWMRWVALTPLAVICALLGGPPTRKSRARRVAGGA